MSRLDIVIFGATGFTGKHAVEEVIRISKKYSELTWAVAGRSQSKLEKLIADIGKKIDQDLSATQIIVADVSDEDSLKAMCSRAKVVVNCCGPYRFYGEPVVRAAVGAKTHYVDVSGEPQFLETMQLKYDAEARAAGAYVVSACGFDSIPNDMGVMFLLQRFEGTLNSVESYLSTDIAPQYQKEARSGVIHYGTWESLVHSLAHGGELGALRKQLYPTRLPTFKPKLQPRSVIHKRDGAWCLPFPGADGSIVYRTQRHLYDNDHKRPVQFRPYVKFPGLLYTMLTIFGGVILYLMSLTGITRRLLLDHPRFFSFGLVTREGPKQVVMDNTHFTFELFGEGWAKGQDVETTSPDKKVVAKVRGVNPGYGATVTALVLSAYTILREHDKMPASGGVMTTGVAFQHTQLIKLLNENQLTFELVADKQ